MGKRRGEKKIQPRLRKRKTRWIVAVAVLLAVGWFAWKGVGTKDVSRLSSGDPAASASYVRRESRVPLSPALFVGKTAATYQMAHEIPDVLDQLYCYCECDRHMGHRSLLSCFTDSHAATWVDICQGEALDASQKVKQGYSMAEIRRFIDQKYSRM